MISEEAGGHKPAPAIFTQALSQAAVKPGSALYVGDHLINDVQGAFSIGMMTALYDPQQKLPHDLPVRQQPQLHLQHFDELLIWLDQQ